MASAGNRHAPDYSDRGPNIISCATVMIVLPTLTVLIRLWSRLVASRIRFWWDDYMLLSTLLCSHVYLAMVIWGVSLGVGKHSWMIPLENLNPTLKSQLVQLLFYGLATCFMRLSAITLYARIFRVSSRTKILLWGLGATVTAWGVCMLVVPWTNCHPVRKTIDHSIPGKCLVRTKWYTAAAVIAFLLDIAILITPMPMVWRLNLRMKKKILVTITLVLGYASAILSLTRLVLIARDPTQLTSAAGHDQSWDLVPILYATSLEVPFGIIALCGPPMNQLFRRAHNFGWRSLLTTKQYSNDVSQKKFHNKPPSDERSDQKRGRQWTGEDNWSTGDSGTTVSQMQIRRDDHISVESMSGSELLAPRDDYGDLELQAFGHQGAGFAQVR